MYRSVFGLWPCLFSSYHFRQNLSANPQLGTSVPPLLRLLVPHWRIIHRHLAKHCATIGSWCHPWCLCCLWCLWCWWCKHHNHLTHRHSETNANLGRAKGLSIFSAWTWYFLRTLKVLYDPVMRKCQVEWNVLKCDISTQKKRPETLRIRSGPSHKPVQVPKKTKLQGKCWWCWCFQEKLAYVDEDGLPSKVKPWNQQMRLVTPLRLHQTLEFRHDKSTKICILYFIRMCIDSNIYI